MDMPILELLKNIGAIIAGLTGMLLVVLKIIDALKGRSPAALVEKVQELHVIVNDRLSQLLEVTAQASHAEGRLEAEQQASSRATQVATEAATTARDLAIETSHRVSGEEKT